MEERIDWVAMQTWPPWILIWILLTLTFRAEFLHVRPCLLEAAGQIPGEGLAGRQAGTEL